MTNKELLQHIQDFIALHSGGPEDESYCTYEETCENVLHDFTAFLRGCGSTIKLLPITEKQPESPAKIPEQKWNF